MPISAKIRMPLDLAMAVLTLVLMGGNGLFYNAFDGAVDSGLVHEVFGVVLFVLWAVHVVLNRAWVKAVLKGKYNALRIVRTIINAGVIVCVLFLMVSGVMLSTHVFAWLGIESGASFARTAHLLASHWYLVLVSLHIGLHLSMFIRGKVATGVMSALAIYGIYAFAIRGLWKYMFLQQPFFFFDAERGYALFFADYIAIVVLFAVAVHYVAKLVKA